MKPIKKREVPPEWRGPWKLPPPRPRIKFIDMKGLVRIDFTRDIMIPNFGLYPEFEQNKYIRQGCMNGFEDKCKYEAK